MSAAEWSVSDADAFPVVESSPEDLAVLRRLLDLALQPPDRFDGFSQVDQLMLGALRYQLNGLSWALSLAQATRTPAFTGYLADAQRAAILKMCDKKVWGYWAYQELVGYGRWNPDPIAHANVMYSGYLGVMIGLYETLNADRSLDRADALTLRWNRTKTYHYGFHSLAEAIQRNMLERPDSPQYPCEPHLIYPICNTFALNTLHIHDRLHGTDLSGDLAQRVRASYERDRWRRLDGRFLTGRIRSGIASLPPSLANDAWMTYWLHPLMPGLAQQTWTMIRDRHLTIANGKVLFPKSFEHRIDVGNYSLRRGGGPTYAMVLQAAREMGADEIHSALDHQVRQRYPLLYAGAAARHQGLSNLADLLVAMARFGGRGVMAALVNGKLPAPWTRGPILASAPYPDVLVARAETDGHGLFLVLRPGNGPVETTLGLERLVPDTEYVVTGASVARIRTRHDGTASVRTALRGRTAVSIVPGPRVAGGLYRADDFTND
ncbi:hypothetical protein ABZV58_29405 [Nocardia sp. NPDC004654]|uniref:linalool dehydratase/isomerase domain-containing protein n=1 Tax=Nocardia sp. NPDC004654 TaxID=3154776 RepID=UPI0033AE1AD7